MAVKLVAALCLAVVCVAAVNSPLAVTPAGDDVLEHGDRKWTHLEGYDVPESMVDRPENAGAHGASVIGFRVSRDVQGSMIVTGIDRPALAVFVGLGVEDRYVNQVADDLRVAFTTADGELHVTELAAGGGHALLFHSPDDVDMKTVRRVDLYHDARARWAK